MSEEANPELEIFRKQWQEEVSARSKGGPSSSGGRGPKNVSKPPGPPKRRSSRPEREPSAAYSNEVSSGALSDGHRDHDLEDQDELRKLGEEGEGIHPSNRTEPQSALEHYEKAIERESQGNLGDSLALYRKAYRLDSGVDKIYKNKYFPSSSVGDKSKAAIVNPSNAAHHSSPENRPPAPPPQFASSSTIPNLIASFSPFPILPTSPDIEASPSFAPCPIGSIPSEILIEILARTAAADIASFARLSLVCKRFAYLIAVEDRLWKEVCLGKDYGFGAMHYDYACTISGQPLQDLFPSFNLRQEEEEEEEEEEGEEEEGREEDKPEAAFAFAPAPLYFPLTPLYPNYKTMFQLRPRIRFSGCYISTVNYIRPGASTPSQISFNTPVHIVTYYRYLRFFRDGTCISLLTTTEPIEVVHHLTKENLLPLSTTTTTSSSSSAPITTTTTGGSAGAGGVMSNALRGRWKLSPPSLLSSSSSSSTTTATKSSASSCTTNSEGDVIIETHGIDPNKYIYKLHLSLRSGANPQKTKNNKLVWVGFWSWNILTDDWAEFGLRNDRPFWWSRVGSYGMGG